MRTAALFSMKTAAAVFHSQISSVFRVPGKKDLYIALADRWLPQRMSLSYEKYRLIFERGFDSNPNVVYTPQQWEETLDIGIKNTVLPTMSGCRLDLTERWPISNGWTSGGLKIMNRPVFCVAASGIAQ